MSSEGHTNGKNRSKARRYSEMKERIDPGDLLAMPGFLTGGAVANGFVDSVPLPLGVDLAGTAVVLPGDTVITWATALALVSFTFVVVTNDFPIKQAGERFWTLVNVYLVYATYTLIIGPALIPALDAILASNTAALLSFAVQTFGYTAVSYSG